MTLNPKGLIARVYYGWERRGGYRPIQMNLCHLMRVLLFWAPLRFLFCRPENERDRIPIGLKVILAAFGGTILGIVVVAVMQDPWNALMGFLIWAGCIIAMMIIIVLSQRAHKTLSRTEGVQVAVAYIAARKQKICPLVKLERREGW